MEVLQIGGGVALGIAALRLAERGLIFVQDAYKKANGKIPSHEQSTHDEAVLAELRLINTNLSGATNAIAGITKTVENNASLIDNIDDATKWLKQREQWKGEKGR